MAIVYYKDKSVECSDRDKAMFDTLWERCVIETGSAAMNLVNAKKYARFARQIGLPAYYDYYLEKSYCDYIFCNDIMKDRVKDVLNNDIKKAMRRFGRAKR